MAKKNNIALVAGGLNGVGPAIAKRLASQGTIVLVCGKDADQLAEMKQAVSGLPGLVVTITADLDSAREVEKMVADIVTTYGRIDQLIVNAEMAPPGSILEVDHNDMQKAVAVNIIQTYTLCQQVAIVMAKADVGGSIVLVSDGLSDGDGKNHELSIAGDMCCGAIERMTRTLAADLGVHQIRVNSVRGQTKDPHKNLPKIPLSRIAEPDEVAAVVAFLAGKKSSFITGAMIPVDGGLGVVR